MLATCLLAIALAGPAADDRPDVAAWIARLGSDSFDDRVEACKALERLGLDALPALRAAEPAGDDRTRDRVRALIESIGRQAEADRFARATLIRPDFFNRPLGEIVDALNAEHDLGLALQLGPTPSRRMMFGDRVDPEAPRAQRAREVTFASPRPLPFWEAIDRLCEAAVLHYELPSGPSSGAASGYPVLIAGRTARGPASDSGPYRVQITGIHSDFGRDFALDPGPGQGAAKAPAVGDLAVSLVVLPEPGLRLYQDGAVIIDEATDDRGRSLVPDVPPKSDPDQVNQSYRFGQGQTCLAIRANLESPEPPGNAIRRLRGKVPVIAVTRGFDPIVVPLKGQGFWSSDFRLVVDEVSFDPVVQVSVVISFRNNRSGRAAGPRAIPGRPNFGAFAADRVPEHLELRDSAGRRIAHQMAGMSRGQSDRYRLVVPPVPAGGIAGGPGAGKAPIPAELRYYPFVQKSIEIPFEFRDIPMP